MRYNVNTFIKYNFILMYSIIVINRRNVMDALKKIKDLLKANGWSVYKLSMKSGVSQSTLANMFARNNQPTIPTLELICKGFGISMSEFFYEETSDKNELTDCEIFLEKYNDLSDNQKRLILEIMDNMK